MNRSRRAGATSSVDFSLLPLTALQRYVQHYNIQISPACGKNRLARAVRDHFARLPVDEDLVLAAFSRSNSGTDEISSPVHKRPKARGILHETPVRRPRKTAKALTYGDMISSAIKQLPSQQGTLDEICDLIEREFSTQLNHELESGPRRIPVWRASVRKIINLNYGMRFRRISIEDGTKAVFSLAPAARRQSTSHH